MAQVRVQLGHDFLGDLAVEKTGTFVSKAFSVLRGNRKSGRGEKGKFLILQPIRKIMSLGSTVCMSSKWEISISTSESGGV